ncbi:MAG: chemotaxis protein CheX [Desulfosarcinaceae bacterium]|jgi:chemotaxis protein CheX
MDVKYINPFVVAIKNVFKTMIDVPFTLGQPALKKDRTPSFEISSIIGLSGNVSGCVVINLSTPVALQLVSALLGDTVTEIDEDTIDAIGEIANMIAGNAKTDFPGENNAISVPSVVTGKHEVSYPSGLPIIAIPCETDAGQMVVEVAIKAKE